jgi:predicted metal-dependent enzyme (double-stranded beta helix superfamily)
MEGKNWIVTADGRCQPCPTARVWDLLEESYRFHRFLTELEDILRGATDENSCLPAIHQLVRKLILNSYWIQTQYSEPEPQTGISVQTLYDEIGFPLTVQTVTFLPGVASPIHNHGIWGVVALLKGREKNIFWKRESDPDLRDKIARVGEVVLEPGDAISFAPDAIHCVEAIGDEPVVTFNVYGETHHRARFEFDPVTHQAKNY